MNPQFLQAQKFIAVKNFNNAIVLLHNCISSDPKFYPAYFELSRLYIMQGREKDTRNLLHNAINQYPDFMELSLLLAEIYMQNLETDIYDLVELYEGLVQRGHHNCLTFFRLSFIYNKLLNNPKRDYYLNLAYEHNKMGMKNANLSLQYEIIDSLLFYFNYEKSDKFYQDYADKLKELPELSLDFVHKYKSWNKSQSSKLRIGFVSGDFRHHSVNFFFKSLIGNLDKTKYEIIGFPTVLDEDEHTLFIKNHCDEWVPVRTDKSKESAEKIHSKNIDILFDLSGHTVNNGLLIFKYKPAPIQVSWLGYFASSGIPEIDYFLTSPYCVHKDEYNYFTEKVLTLPETYLCYDFSQHSIEQSAMPYDKNGYLTFGFFQNLNKISDTDIQVWENLLNKIPDAKLIIKSSELSQPKLKEEFMTKIKDLPMSRIELRGHTDLNEHIRQHNDIDIMLDGYTVSGCTTTCQSLYMGVPIFVYEGYSMLTRHGEQFMSVLNLKEFIAKNEDDFIDKAANIDINNLRDIKASLRQNVLSSSIGNGKIFTQQFENIIELIKGS